MSKEGEEARNIIANNMANLFRKTDKGELLKKVAEFGIMRLFLETAQVDPNKLVGELILDAMKKSEALKDKDCKGFLVTIEAVIR